MCQGTVEDTERRRGFGVVRTLLLLGLSIWSLSLPAEAQQNLGSIVGTVTDPSGAVMPGVSVTARHVSTDTVTKVTTNADGAYTLLDLKIGEYALSLGATGFKTLKQEVLVEAGVTAKLDFKLLVGEASQIVEVSAIAPQVNTSASSIGTTRVTEEMAELPVLMLGNNRGTLSLLRTMPGVSPSTAADTPFGSTGIETTQISGSPGGGQSYTVDGVRGSVSAHGQIRDDFQPPPEMVAEMRVIDSGSSEYGWNSGVGVALVLKSGTNALHGNVFEYLRNNAFDSRNFFASSVSINKQNEFGFTLGGPVVIPKVYNGKNKTFFFGMYSGFRYRTAAAGSTGTVPTAQMENGDFSQWLGAQIGTDALGRPVYTGEIYDPTTTRTLPNGTIVRDPFQSNGQLNVIPPTEFSSISKAVQAGFPAPNLPGVLQNWVGVSTSSPVNTNKGALKIDHLIGDGRQRISVGWDQWSMTNVSGGFPVAHIISPDTINLVLDVRARIVYSATIGTNKVFAVRVAGNANPQGTFASRFPESTTGGTTLGIQNTYNHVTPEILFENFPTLGNWRGGQNNSPDWIIPANADFSWAKGNHDIKIGGEYLNNNITAHTCSNCMGVFSFKHLETALPNFGNTGVDYASFLLGQLDGATVSNAGDFKYQSGAYGFFGQDTWRVSPKLTVNIGLRWDLFYPPREQFDRMSNFDPNIPNPAVDGHLGATTFWGMGAGRNGLDRMAPLVNAWSPRIGLAYSLNSKTVIRASYGLSNNALFGVFSGGYGLPFNGGSAGWLWTGSQVSQDAGVTPAYQWDQGHGIPFTAPPLPNLNPSIANGTNTAYWPQNGFKPARVQNIDFGIERQLPGGIIAKADYVGNMAHRTPQGSVKMDQMPLSDLSYGSSLLLNINSPQAQALGIPSPYPGFNGSVAQALTPFPQYSQVSNFARPEGFSEYNALQLAVQKQVGHGLTVLGSYTVSKELTNGGPWYNQGYDVNAGGYLTQHESMRWSNKWVMPCVFATSCDRPQDLEISYVYELPLGRGKRWLSTNNAVLGQVVGGWRVAGFHSYFSGDPMRLATNQSIPGGFGPIWTNRVLGVPIRTSNSCGNYDPHNPASKQFLNGAAFTDPAPFTVGNTLILSNVRGCGFENENFSAQKLFRFGEKEKLVFSADFSNIFNRVRWNKPSNNIDLSTFGQIFGAQPPRLVQFHLAFEF